MVTHRSSVCRSNDRKTLLLKGMAMTGLHEHRGKHRTLEHELNTTQKKQSFLDALQAGEGATAAARSAGVSRTRAYEWRADPNFAARWDAITESAVRRQAPLGAARMIAVRDSKGQPVLGQDLEQLFALDVSAIDPAVIAKLTGRALSR